LRQRSVENDPITVFALDDNRDILDLLDEIFQGTAHSLLVAENINQARKVLRDNKVDVILLDIVIGRENGLDFLGELKRSPRTASIPVIIHSAAEETLLKSEAENLGAKNWLKKPSRPEEIITAVESAHLRYYRGHEMIPTGKE